MKPWWEKTCFQDEKYLITWLGSGREMSPVHRRISSPRSWIRTSSSRTSIILVLKRNMSWRHILFSYLNLLTPNPAHQPIRTVQNLGSFQFVSKTSSVRRIKYPWNMLSLVGSSLIEAWLDWANLIESQERLVPVLSWCFFGENLTNYNETFTIFSFLERIRFHFQIIYLW